MRRRALLLLVPLLATCGEPDAPPAPPETATETVADPAVERPRERTRDPPPAEDTARATWESLEEHVPGEVDLFVDPTALLARIGGADAVSRIATALRSPTLDDAQRAGLLRLLQQLGPHALPALDAVLTLVDAADEDVRFAAVRAVGAMGEGAARAVPALRTAMAERGGGGVFAEAFARLGQRGWDELGRLAFDSGDTRTINTGLHGLAVLDPQPALSYVPRALGSPDPIVRLHALGLIREFEEASAPYTEHVVALLDDEDEDVREGALATLEEMREGAAAAVPVLLERHRVMGEDHDDYDDWLRAIASAGREDGEATRYLAVAVAADGDWSERAASYLKQFGADVRAVVPELGVALDGHTSVRIPVMDMIMRVGPDAAPLASKVVADLAPDRHDALRQSAARALIGIGPAAESALPALRDLGEDASPNLRVVAALAIHAISGDVEPARAVMDELADKQGDWLYSWRYEIPGLMGAGGAVFLPELREFLNGDEQSREYALLSAIRSFELIGPPAAAAVPDLVAAISEKRNATWVDDLGRALEAIGIDDAQALDVWAPLLRHESDDARLAAAEALGRRGAAAGAALPDLRRLVLDTDWRIRRAAREAVAAIER